jgi:hypothetical protein
MASIWDSSLLLMYTIEHANSAIEHEDFRFLGAYWPGWKILTVIGHEQLSTKSVACSRHAG